MLPRVRHTERDPRRIERGEEGDQPEPCGWGIGSVWIDGLGDLGDGDGAQQRSEGVLLVVHPCLAAEEPGALHAVRCREGRRLAGVGLRLDRQPGDAHRPCSDHVAEVGQPWFGVRDAPQTRQSFADDAVPSATRYVRAADEGAPGPRLLAHPAHRGAEQPGEAPGVGDLVVGECSIVRVVARRDGLRQPVGSPMVRDRWPVSLDLVALRRQIAADAVGGLAP